MRVLFNDRNLRRAVVLAIFVALLVVFRHLALLFVFFVLFSRSIDFCAQHVARLTRLRYNFAVLAVVVVSLAATGLLVYLGARGVITNLDDLKHSAAEIAATIEYSPIYQRFAGAIDLSGTGLIERMREHGKEVVHYLSVFGRGALYLLIAYIIAVVFLLERDELEAMRADIAAESAGGVILRYIGHVADAVAIMFRLQFVVAVVNAFFTLPILLALHMPGIAALMVLLIVSGLIPVVGGVVAGGVLMTIAFITKGVWGLALFIVWTFVLHKLESYVLTPRLTARHVHLPSFVIVVSLLLFEHLFGIAGLFMSFPFLYVTARMRESE